MNLLQRLRGEPERAITTIDDYAAMWNAFQFNGLSYGYGLSGSSGIQQTLAGRATELAPNNFVGLATHAYGANGVVFACMLVRMLIFSSIRFRWQRLRNGKPSETFGNPDLGILERPWVGGTTQDMLVRTIQDADLAGNAYWYLDTPLARLGTSDPNKELVRMRPDWIQIAVEPREIRGGALELGGGQIGWRKVGYVYCEGGPSGDEDPVALLPDEVAHFAPIPDPLATYRGMSWLTPILREIQADQSMTRHQSKFFDNGATPNLVVKHFGGAPGIAGADPAAIQKFADEMQSKFGGVENAYKTMHLYPGADVTVVGSNFKDIDFKSVRGGGETRVAAAAGVPPVIVGLSEGLAASTYSNYSQARRRLADGTAHPLWQNLSGSVEHILPSPGPGTRLWYDATDVPFLREDEKDAAEIQQIKATTVNSYITAGYEPDSVVAAVESNDLGLLVHSGLYSVQLQQPGQETAPPQPAPAANGQPPGGNNGATVNA